MNGQDPYRQQFGQVRRSGARRAAAKRRGVAGPILAALVVLGLLGGSGWYFLNGGWSSTATSQDGPIPNVIDDSPTAAGNDSMTPSDTPSATPTPSAAPTPTPSATPTRRTSAPSRSTTRPTQSTTTPAQSTAPTRRPAKKPTKKQTQPAPTGSSPEAQVLSLTNAERQKAGCGPLQTNSALTEAAEEHAADMVDNHYFAHDSLDGSSPFDRMKEAGFTGGAMAENIAVGYTTAAAVVEGWMNSEGHRKNILNCDYTMIGIGYDPGVVQTSWGNGSWVQDFGG